MYRHVLPCIAMYCHVFPGFIMYYHVLPCITMYYHVVIEVIDGSGVVRNSKNIAELYNFVVSSDKVKEIGRSYEV